MMNRTLLANTRLGIKLNITNMCRKLLFTIKKPKNK